MSRLLRVLLLSSILATCGCDRSGQCYVTLQQSYGMSPAAWIPVDTSAVDDDFVELERVDGEWDNRQRLRFGRPIKIVILPLNAETAEAEGIVQQDFISELSSLQQENRDLKAEVTRLKAELQLHPTCDVP